MKEPYVSSSTTRRARPDDGPHFGPPRTRHGGPVSASAWILPPSRRRWGVRSDTRRDAQAGVPSARRPRAQLAFKDSMVHGILQFTPSIAFRYVLHRCESLDIRCRESYGSTTLCNNFARPLPVGGAAALVDGVPWRPPRRGFVMPPADAEIAHRGALLPGPACRIGVSRPRAGRRVDTFAIVRWFRFSTMILPQVHLRKPCYDFSFL